MNYQVFLKLHSVRNKFLLEKLLTNGKHVLAVGPTGTGKTVNIMDYLQTDMKEMYVPLTLSFSARSRMISRTPGEMIVPTFQDHA